MIKNTVIGTGLFIVSALAAGGIAFAQTDMPTSSTSPMVSESPTVSPSVSPSTSPSTLPSGAPSTGKGL